MDTIRAHDQKANLQERITLLIKRRKKSISSIAMSTTAQSTLIKLLTGNLIPAEIFLFVRINNSSNNYILYIRWMIHFGNDILLYRD